MSDEEIFFVSDSNDISPEDQSFDEMVGGLEQVLFSDDFQDLQNKFFKKHAGIFKDSEENKVEYTPIFNEYTKLMEKTLETQLKKVINGFNMKKFENMIAERMDEIAGIEVFDTLLSFTDFEEFKLQILAYKVGQSSGIACGGTQLSK